MDDYRKIGIGLTAAGMLFFFLGIMLLFDKGLLAMGNVRRRRRHPAATTAAAAAAAAAPPPPLPLPPPLPPLQPRRAAAELRRRIAPQNCARQTHARVRAARRSSSSPASC